MDDLLVRELTLTLKFSNREVVLEFEEPTIYMLLKFWSLIKKEKYVSAIKLIIPKIDEKDFLSNPIWIITWVRNLIYWEQKKKVWGSVDDDEVWFFPSAIDMMAHRYWQVPTELIKMITFSQLMVCTKGYEWNLNIQNWQEKKNIRLLAEMDENDEQIEKDRLQVQKDREFFKKHWWLRENK